MVSSPRCNFNFVTSPNTARLSGSTPECSPFDGCRCRLCSLRLVSTLIKPNARHDICHFDRSISTMLIVSSSIELASGKFYKSSRFIAEGTNQRAVIIAASVAASLLISELTKHLLTLIDYNVAHTGIF